MYLTDSHKISIGSTTTAGAAAQTEIDATGLNMSGYDGVIAIVPFGAIVGGAATSLKWQQSSDNGGSDGWSDIEGTSQTVSDASDDKVFYAELFRPTKQYVRLVILRATQNATVGGVIYIQFAAKGVRPPTQGTNVSGESFTCPAEGTA